MIPETCPIYPHFEMSAKKHSVTIQQVAKAAGVSVSTVSRVLESGSTQYA
jgi:DNA invertase Pin-like site-specific DNA recombinase